MLSLVLLSFLPDADVIAFQLGIPYGAPFGHRGAMHSLAFAAIVAVVVWAIVRKSRRPAMGVAAAAGLVVASHGLLDAMTDGGRGIALLWPFSDERYFAPWRPIPVAPIGLRILAPAGLVLMATEAVLFLPLWMVAFWPRRR
jgi:inner membrane protein